MVVVVAEKTENNWLSDEYRDLRRTVKRLMEVVIGNIGWNMLVRFLSDVR